MQLSSFGNQRETIKNMLLDKIGHISLKILYVFESGSKSKEDKVAAFMQSWVSYGEGAIKLGCRGNL